MNSYGREQSLFVIDLWPVIKIHSPQVGVEQLGIFSDKNLNKWLKIKSVVVDLQPGQYQFFNKIQLRKLFSIPKNTKLSGPRFVKIVRGGHQIEMTPLVDEAKALLKQHYGKNIRLEPLAKIKPLELASREYHWQLSHQKKNGNIARLCVLAEVSYGNGKKAKTKRRTVPLWFKATLEKYVWILTTDVASKSHFSPVSVMLKQHNIANVQGRVLHELPNLNQQRFVAAYQQGAVLTTAMLEPIPPVEKGKPVRVTSISGRVIINAKAIALEDGKLQQQIKVQSLSSGETYLATVIGENTVLAGH